MAQALACPKTQSATNQGSSLETSGRLLVGFETKPTMKLGASPLLCPLLFLATWTGLPLNLASAVPAALGFRKQSLSSCAVTLLPL